jgi:hypothetical protein
VEPTNQVSCLINNLTTDEDLRQELWVHYLSGHSTDSFSSHLQKIKLEYSDDVELKRSIYHLIKNPLPQNLTDLLGNFTEFERCIICFLMLGLNIEKIAQVKGISEVRIRQSITNIRYNKCWSEVDGIKNQINRR